MYRMDACPNCATLRRENDDLKQLVENLSSELAGHIGAGSNGAASNAICDGIADAISSEPDAYNPEIAALRQRFEDLSVRIRLLLATEIDPEEYAKLFAEMKSWFDEAKLHYGSNADAALRELASEAQKLVAQLKDRWFAWANFLEHLNEAKDELEELRKATAAAEGQAPQLLPKELSVLTGRGELALTILTTNGDALRSYSRQLYPMESVRQQMKTLEHVFVDVTKRYAALVSRIIDAMSRAEWLKDASELEIVTYRYHKNHAVRYVATRPKTRSLMLDSFQESVVHYRQMLIDHLADPSEFLHAYNHIRCICVIVFPENVVESELHCRLGQLFRESKFLVDELFRRTYSWKRLQYQRKYVSLKAEKFRKRCHLVTSRSPQPSEEQVGFLHAAYRKFFWDEMEPVLESVKCLAADLDVSKAEQVAEEIYNEVDAAKTDYEAIRENIPRAPELYI